MELRDDGRTMHFLHHGGSAGGYAYGDPYKPHLHPLNTPSGKTLSLASPHDHRHHKGLMYSLQTADVNFWEEVEKPGLSVGVQEHVSFESLAQEADEVGFVQTLVWRAAAGGEALLDERRMVVCRHDPGGAAFVWRWQTSLRAARAVRLEMSRSSHVTAGGSRVNYHGLGIRFIRDFGCTGGTRLLVDGEERSAADALGCVPRAVTLVGSLDGRWPVERAAVSITQGQPNALFVMETPFAFMSLGPTNTSARELAAGEVLSEAYEVRAFDWPHPGREPSA